MQDNISPNNNVLAHIQQALVNNNITADTCFSIQQYQGKKGNLKGIIYLKYPDTKNKQIEQLTYSVKYINASCKITLSHPRQIIKSNIWQQMYEQFQDKVGLTDLGKSVVSMDAELKQLFMTNIIMPVHKNVKTLLGQHENKTLNASSRRIITKGAPKYRKQYANITSITVPEAKIMHKMEILKSYINSAQD